MIEVNSEIIEGLRKVVDDQASKLPALSYISPEGLGIPVIRSCQSDQLGDLHFDTRQYYHIE